MKILVSPSGLVELNKVKNYQDHREQLIKKGRGVAFNEAVKQMEDNNNVNV